MESPWYLSGKKHGGGGAAASREWSKHKFRDRKQNGSFQEPVGEEKEGLRSMGRSLSSKPDQPWRLVGRTVGVYLVILTVHLKTMKTVNPGYVIHKKIQEINLMKMIRIIKVKSRKDILIKT